MVIFLKILGIFTPEKLYVHFPVHVLQLFLTYTKNLQAWLPNQTMAKIIFPFSTMTFEIPDVLIFAKKYGLMQQK